MNSCNRYREALEKIKNRGECSDCNALDIAEQALASAVDSNPTIINHEPSTVVLGTKSGDIIIGPETSTVTHPKNAENSILPDDISKKCEKLDGSAIPINGNESAPSMAMENWKKTIKQELLSIAEYDQLHGIIAAKIKGGVERIQELEALLEQTLGLRVRSDSNVPYGEIWVEYQDGHRIKIADNISTNDTDFIVGHVAPDESGEK